MPRHTRRAPAFEPQDTASRGRAQSGPRFWGERTEEMEIIVRKLEEGDLEEAHRILRLAFGTMRNLPDPLDFGGDTDYVRSRWRANPGASLAAELDRELVGTNFLARWGSVGLFGPLTVRPDLWDRGIGTRLLEATVEIIDSWGVKLSGIITEAKSPKHLAFYQRFGYWPRFLIAIMDLEVGEPRAEERAGLYSSFPESHRDMALGECREVTASIYEGLDLSLEIRAVLDHDLGDTVLLWGRKRIEGFAVCHIGPGTEAGTGVCYVKFGAVRTGADAGQTFARLINGCHNLAAKRGAQRLVAGVNTARHEAYTQMIEHGLRTTRLDIAMQRPNEAGYNRPGVFVIDDWR